MNLPEMYAEAARRLPDAKAISIMAGCQTQNNGLPLLEWWTVLVYATPIGENSVVSAHCTGDTFEDALSLAVKRIECDHQWIASYTADEQIDGYDCPKCGEHKGIGEELKEGE